MLARAVGGLAECGIPTRLLLVVESMLIKFDVATRRCEA